MGYTTKFKGQVNIVPPLNLAEHAYLKKFAYIRHVHRHNGPYFVDDDNMNGRAADVINEDVPDPGQPELYCSWAPTEDGTALKWDGAEKFYESVKWMQYLIDHFLKPGAYAEGQPGFEGFSFNHVLNGTIDAQGEEVTDVWRLVVRNNVVTQVEAKVYWPDDGDDETGEEDVVFTWPGPATA